MLWRFRNHFKLTFPMQLLTLDTLTFGSPLLLQCLCPVSVAEGSGQTPSLLTPSPQTYVRHALKTLGVSCYTHGYFPHALQVSVLWGFLHVLCIHTYTVCLVRVYTCHSLFRYTVHATSQIVVVCNYTRTRNRLCTK